METTNLPLDSTRSHSPAWKRLGLKLKYAQDLPPDPISVTTNSIPVKSGINKNSAPPSLDLTSPKRRKSVTFTDDTKREDGDSIKQLFNDWVAIQNEVDPIFFTNSTEPAIKVHEPSKVDEQTDPSLTEPERRVKRIKKSKSKDDQSLKSNSNSTRENIPSESKPQPQHAALTYLKNYHDSRETWKFNKVHQIYLLKNAFDPHKIPAAYIDLLYIYISGLQGQARTKLRDAALAIKVNESKSGSESTSPSKSSTDKMPSEKDIERDAKYYAHQHTHNLQAVEQGPNVGYEEGVSLGLSDDAMKVRMQKRARADKILQQLAASKGVAEPKLSGEAYAAAAGFDYNLGLREPEKPIEILDDPVETVAAKAETGKKRGRKRKLRTQAAVDSSASSSSENSDDREYGKEKKGKGKAGKGKGKKKVVKQKKEAKRQRVIDLASSEVSDSS